MSKSMNGLGKNSKAPYKGSFNTLESLRNLKDFHLYLRESELYQIPQHIGYNLNDNCAVKNIYQGASFHMCKTIPDYVGNPPVLTTIIDMFRADGWYIHDDSDFQNGYVHVSTTATNPNAPQIS